MKKLFLSIIGLLSFGILVISYPYYSFAQELKIKKASAIRQESPQEVETYFASQDTNSLKSAYQELGVIVYPEDQVWAFPNPDLGIGSKIEIIRAPILYVNDAGTKFVLRCWDETISDCFAAKNLHFNPDDEVSPDPGSLIENGMRINITRITKNTVKEEVNVPYKTKYIDDNNLEKGKTKVVQEGKIGKKEVVYKIITENGIEVSREILTETMLETMQNKIIARGTKILYRYLGTGDATYYCLPPAPCNGMTAAFNGYKGSYLRVTANGKSITVKVVGKGPVEGTAYIDLSPAAFSQLAPLWQGRIHNVKVELVL